MQQEQAGKILDHMQAQYSPDKFWNITVILQDDEAITRLHKDYLDDNTPTDVITFDLSEPDEEEGEGEIYISVDRAKENSQTYKVSLFSEVYRLIIHGLLHLMGFDDHTDVERTAMREKEDTILENFDLL